MVGGVVHMGHVLAKQEINRFEAGTHTMKKKLRGGGGSAPVLLKQIRGKEAVRARRTTSAANTNKTRT